MLDRSLRPPAEAGPGAAAAEGRGNVDRVLFKDRVEMVPLVDSLMVSACFASSVHPPEKISPHPGVAREALACSLAGGDREVL
jgi:hypothetical protein